MGIGSKLAGITTDMYTIDGVKDWTSIWTIPAAISGVVLFLFLLFFNDKTRVKSEI
ncbi:MAG: hypothetical protein QMB24_06110 [Spirosomataceae bacterium]|jgi:hypothetical protein